MFEGAGAAVLDERAGELVGVAMRTGVLEGATDGFELGTLVGGTLEEAAEGLELSPTAVDLAGEGDEVGADGAGTDDAGTDDAGADEAD